MLALAYVATRTNGIEFLHRALVPNLAKYLVVIQEGFDLNEYAGKQKRIRFVFPSPKASRIQ